MGLPEAVALARELDRLPTRLIVYGIEGESFETGEGLSDPVPDDRREARAGPLSRAQRGELVLAPFGGAGKSGVGRELSEWFLESFTERKLLVFELGDAELKYDRRAEGGW